ncbi:ankyrin repeat family protein [Rhynchospora pubera]|uniref:Ankyrin repeat family protein n=1 Tax=Rhynchospora pubera TaxID=906938 RepID=A0AAV8ECE8_9POAL|nr:ankyrin repeat family protein [Rhynchospora pubera]
MILFTVIAKKIVKARHRLAREENESGNTPMHLSVLWNKLDVIRVLLEHDRSLGYLINSKSNYPLLVSAAFRGNVAVTQEILNYCPDAPCCRQDGWTMLHEAIYTGHEEFTEFILKTPQLHNLINMRDINGETALHIAVKKCNPKVVHALLAHRAIDITVVSKLGDAPEGSLNDAAKRAKTLNWNEVLAMMKKANPQALTLLFSQEAKKEITYRSNEEIKSLTSTYTNNTSLVAILIATITFAAAFTLPGGYSNDSGSEGLPILVKKAAFKAFIISDTLAMCSSLAVAFICILTRWEDLEFLLYYRFYTKKLMWFAYGATTVAFATGLYTVMKSPVLWLAILICIVSTGSPFLAYLLAKWPILKLQCQLYPAFNSYLLDMV